MQLRSRIFLPILFIIFLLGCKQEIKNIPAKVEINVIEELISPAQSSSSLPHLMANKDVVLLSWVETEGDTLATFKYAELIDGQWQPAQIILNSTDWFINWADYPMITENNGSLWSHVLKKSTKGTYSYDVKMNVKPNDNEKWITDIALHTDGTPTEHGFVSVQPYKDAFFVNWLDGRNTEENEVGERGAMTLRAGIVSIYGKIIEEYELDANTCDCCQTTSAITDNGPIVIYRDRSADEIRDISIVRQVNGEWTAPKVIHEDNWQIKGCPVNGPKVAALGNELVVTWFTGAENKQKVQLAFSSDGGEEFNSPIVIAEGVIMGRVDVLWLNEDSAVVSWMEAKDKTAVFNVMQVSKEGKTSKKQIITKMKDSRKSGFPQMEIVDETLYFAWTEEVKTETKVRTARMSVDAFLVN